MPRLLPFVLSLIKDRVPKEDIRTLARDCANDLQLIALEEPGMLLLHAEYIHLTAAAIRARLARLEPDDGAPEENGKQGVSS